MGVHESIGKSDEWYTPEYIFKALDVEFDIDVASPKTQTFVPAKEFIYENSLSTEWKGFIWMNPPWCSTKEKDDWIRKFVKHGNGIALMPDSSSSKWWQHLSSYSEAILFTNGRVKFIKPDGSIGANPANGTCLFAIGKKGVISLMKAQSNGLGVVLNNLITNQTT